MRIITSVYSAPLWCIRAYICNPYIFGQFTLNGNCRQDPYTLLHTKQYGVPSQLHSAGREQSLVSPLLQRWTQKTEGPLCKNSVWAPSTCNFHFLIKIKDLLYFSRNIQIVLVSTAATGNIPLDLWQGGVLLILVV